MDSNSVKQIKKLVTEMFHDHYQKCVKYTMDLKNQSVK